VTPVHEIVGDPERFVGRTVVGEAAVSNPIDHRVWEMANGRLFMIEGDSAQPPPKPGQVLCVEGTVCPLRPATIEGELGIDIEDPLLSSRTTWPSWSSRSGAVPAARPPRRPARGAVPRSSSWPSG
jgi:hypothetical protein